MSTQLQFDAETIQVSLPREAFAALTRVAEAENTSVADLVLAEVLQFARMQTRPIHTPEQILSIIREAQAELRAANPANRDLVTELLEERRREAARE